MIRNSTDPKLNAETRRRLLEAASEVFAAKGFRQATVREIVARAKANIAAVNYHFGDKAGLYEIVLTHALGNALQKYPPTLGTTPHSTPQERLFAFVHSFFLRILAEGPTSYHGRLMAREMASPTPALATVCEMHIKPLNEMLVAILRELLGPSATPEIVRRCVASVAGQVLFYHHGRAVISHFNPDLKFDAIEIEALARHVTKASLAMVEEYRREKRA